MRRVARSDRKVTPTSTTQLIDDANLLVILERFTHKRFPISNKILYMRDNLCVGKQFYRTFIYALKTLLYNSISEIVIPMGEIYHTMTAMPTHIIYLFPLHEK